MKLWAALLLSSAQLLLGQNVLVKFNANNQPYPGLTNYPAAANPCSFATNATGWDTNFTLASYLTYVGTMYPLYLSAAITNGISLATAISNNPAPLSFDAGIWFTPQYNASNFIAFMSMTAQIPQGIADSSNRLAAMTVAFNSFNSGTNTAAGTNAIFKTTIQDGMMTWTYLNQLIVYLSRLSQVLVPLYQPGSDPVGH